MTQDRITGNSMSDREFEDRLMSMDVPEHRDDLLREKLRSQLLEKFISERRVYRTAMRWAVAAASIFLCILVVALTRPDLVQQLHEQPVSMEFSAGMNAGIKHETQKTGKVDYTGILNPTAENFLPPGMYREKRAWIIREFQSPENGIVTVVSEYNKKPDQTPLLRLAGGI